MVVGVSAGCGPRGYGVLGKPALEGANVVVAGRDALSDDDEEEEDGGEDGREEDTAEGEQAPEPEPEPEPRAAEATEVRVGWLGSGGGRGRGGRGQDEVLFRAREQLAGNPVHRGGGFAEKEESSTDFWSHAAGLSHEKLGWS